VYVGNASLGVGSDTVCPSCGALAIERRGYRTRVVRVDGGRCGACGEDLNLAC